MAYFANGTEGIKLDVQCAECPVGQIACPIWLAQTEFNYKQVINGETDNDLVKCLNILVNERGDCQMMERFIKLGMVTLPDSTAKNTENTRNG